MASIKSGRVLLGRALASVALGVGLFANVAHAELYNGTPTRTIGPFGSSQASPAPSGGWIASDDRVVGASLGGQGGWSIPCSPTKYDEGISNLMPRTGLQSWRVSNWFHEGCVNTVLSPAFASVGESAGPTGSITSSFWFRVPTGNAGLLVSSSLGDAAGQRMTYAAIRDDGGVLTVQVVGINQATGFGGPPLPAPFDDAGVEYDVRSSTALAHSQWYQLRVSANLAIGPRDDIVVYDVLNSLGAVVWTSGAMKSWEDAYLAGVFSPTNTKVTISRLAFRLVENPDNLANRNPNATYALNRPTGVYIDDLNVSPGGGVALNVGFEGDRYISATGSDSGTCATATPASARCRTLAYALSVAQPYNRIHVAAGGTYTGTSVVAKAGIQILGEGSPKPVIRQDSGAINQRLIVVNDVRNVKIDGLDFQADKTYVGAGILAMGDVEGLVISNNQFSQSQSGAASTFGLTNAIAINYSNELANLDPAITPALTTKDGSTVLIENNTVLGSGTLFRAGIQMDRGLGIIRGNTITSGTQDIVVRFPTFVAGRSSSSKVTINNNQSLGRGVQITSPNAGGVTGIEFLNNTVSAVVGYPGGADAYALAPLNPSPADFSLMRLVNNPQGVPLLVSGNTFTGHAGTYRGVLVQNYPGLVLTGNTFTPKAAATDFASLVFSSKELTTDNPPSAPLALSVDARGNTFNGSSTSFAGRAVEFINDHDASGTAAQGSLSFGGAGADANNFSGSHRWYFRLDDQNCDFATGGAGNCGALNYSGVNANVPPTQIRPFRFNVNATQNLFNGAAPANPAQIELRSRTYDRLANPALGIVDYNVAAIQTDVYVDDSFAGSTYGQPLVFNGDVDGVAVQFGINAFTTVNAALMAVETGGTVHVAVGTYPGAVLLNKRVFVIGDGTTPAGSVFTGGITLDASGTATSTPLLMKDLRAANAAGNGITLVGNHSFIALEGVASSGNLRNGLFITSVVPGSSTNIAIRSSHFDDNGPQNPASNSDLVAGVNFADGSSVDGLLIDQSTFNGNNGAGLTFNDIGGPNGATIYKNIDITDSEFSRNNPGDFGNAGGGIWLKTAGNGSRIEGVEISGSTFADNGTAQINTFAATGAASRKMNANGISIRARANTFLRDIKVCNNTFSETGALGTQVSGINIYDQTANNGYEPVEICNNNTFAGLAYSVSGHEQNGSISTQPIVLFTGSGTLSPAPEEVNGYVTRLRDVATFTTISAALADPGTVADDVISVPSGQYNENLVITQNRLTLQGAGIASGTATILDGTTRSGNGITIGAGVTGVTIDGLHVRDFTAIGSASGACIVGAMSNSGFTLTGSRVENCAGGRGGVFLAGGGAIDDVTITGNEVTATDGRAVVIWDGFKTNITISNNVVTNITGCCGIELQDGTASGVKIEGNTLTNIGDSALAMNGLTSGAGPNLIRNNTISLAKRFGIEIKMPNGTGSTDVSSDGAIIVSGNSVTRTGALTDARDIGGIVVIRRAYGIGQGYVDIPTGVVVQGNTVSGWTQPGSGTGHGIVVEGTQMRVLGNTLSGNDINVQRQAGNDGYVANGIGDSDQGAFNDYFARGNSPQTCAMVDGPVTSVDTRPAAASMEPIAANANTGRFYCTVQSAIDDGTTLAGHTIHVYDGETVAEQVLVNKRLRITEEPGNFGSRAKFVAPAAVSDLALFRVSAPNVEIDNLDFVVDLSKVGEAIRTVGGTPAGDPSGINIHHNSIVATASSSTMVAYGRRNALSLNLSNSSGYAPPSEQVTNLSVTVSNNNIDGTQDWDSGTAGNQPAFFRSAIGLDQGAGTISANTLRGRDYDGFIRFSNGGGLSVGPNNNFNGGGLYLGDGIVPISVGGNVFVPDRALLPFADFALPVGAARWGDLGFSAVRLVNAGPVTLATNTFSEQTNAVFAQNVGALTLTSNIFNAPTHGAQFRHVIASTKVMSSGSATVTQVPIGIAATGNTFNGGPGGTAVELLNHDSDNAGYAALSFGGASVGSAPNLFDGAFTYYFRLDASTGPSTAVAEPYLSTYGYATTPATTMAPFGNTSPIQALDNEFQGVAPSAMSTAQIAELQARTYHNDPAFPESPASPAGMGMVDYALASGIVPTTTSILSATPAQGVVGTAVLVTVNVVTNAPFNGTPTGMVTVSGGGSGAGASCVIANYPTASSCSLGAFTTSGLKTITATFTDGSFDDSSATVGYQVFTMGPNPTTEVTPVDPLNATATDNDYTRINNAVQLMQSGDTVVLTGTFNWTEPNASASWMRGSNGVVDGADLFGSGDDFMIQLPTGVNGGTLRAATPGAATIIANESGSLNDLGVFIGTGGVNTDWTFQNLAVQGFDMAFATAGGAVGSVNDTSFVGNQIAVPADTGDFYGNYAIYTGYGENQTIAGNQIMIDISGADGSLPTNARGNGIVIDGSCNNACANGLAINGNSITVAGTPAATPPAVLGIWENQGDSNSSISIQDNTFSGSGDLGSGVGGNRQTAMAITTQSNGARLSDVTGNTITGAAVGLTGQIPIFGFYVVSDAPLRVEGNTFLNNGEAMRFPAAYPGAAKYTIRFNRIVGNAVGIHAERADDLPLPGAPGYGGDELPSQITVTNNWWGCSEGPSDSDCDSLEIAAGADPAVVTQLSWLQLSASASPTTIAANSGTSTITTKLVPSSGSILPSDLARFPEAPYGFATSLGVMNPTSIDSPDGTAQSQLTSATAGGALVTTSLDNGTATTNVLVTNVAGGTIVTVLACDEEPCVLPNDNDYTRINNAVQALTSNTTLELVGNFDWTQADAAASWALGSDGIAGTGDEYGIEPPRNLSGVTITAPAPGAASISGPGDLPGANLEGVFSLYGGSFRGWTFSNLDIGGFDLAIGMFFNGGPPDAFDNVKVLDNTITIPNDLNTVVAPLDTNQNIGIHYAFGRNQQFDGNTFNLSSSGVSDGVNYSTSIAMQSNTSGGGRYDGLRISNNTVNILGASTLGANPPRLYGIWENAQDFTAGDIQVFDNQFLNDTGAAPPANNLWRGFMLTSQSAGVSYRNNTVRGASVGFTTIIGAGYTPAASSAATVLEGNTLVGNLIGIRVDSDNGDAKVTARFNRIAGNGIGVQQLNAAVDARNNWWGCNGGPGAVGCTTLAGGATTSPWLKLAIEAFPTSFVAGTPTGSAITTTLVNNTDNNVPSGMGAFPIASYAYATSLGAVSPTPVLAADGLAQSTLTSATAGGALMTTTLDNGSASTSVLVTNSVGPGNTVTLTPATTPTATDNDYTRINNAVQALANGTTLILAGQFDWSPNGQRPAPSQPDPNSYAYQSWLNGAIGVTGSSTGWSIIPPRGLAGVTITAAAPGGAVIRGPGDVASGNLEGVFSMGGGTYHEWTISNLEFSGFDLPIGMHHTAGGPPDAFRGVAIVDNVIRMPADGPDANQNIGLHFAYGKGQTIEGNTFHLDASGSTTVGMQSETSGGDLYDNLLIKDNTIRVIGTPLAVPGTVIGIWENNQGFTVPAAITVTGNRFVNQTSTPAPTGVTWRAFQLTSQSVGTKQVVYRNNHVDGASVAFTTITGSFTFSPGAGSLPTVIEGNTILNSGVAIRAVAQPGFNAQIDAHFNRIDGSGVGILQANATVNAENNWWGCNAGPDQAGCSTLSASGSGTQVTAPWLKLSIASDTATVGAGGLALLTASVNGNSNGDDLSGTTMFPVTEIAFTDDSSATMATPTAPTGSTASTRGIAGNTLSGIQTQTIASATLDSQPVSTTINVNQVSLHVDLPAAGVVGITSAPFPLVIDNNGAALTETSKVYLTIKRNPSPLLPANLTLEYQSPSNPANWLPVVLTSQSADTLIGQMSVGTLAAGTLTVNLRATSSVDGIIEFFAILVGDTSNSLYSSDGGSVAVAAIGDVEIALVSGSPQSAQVNTTYVAPLVVKVTDADGNPLANVPVTFTAPTTGATVSYATASGTTAVDGTIASGTITANSTAGAVTTAQASVAASACSSPTTCTVAFSLTNTVTGSGAGLVITGDTVGVVTLPSAASIHSSSTATVQLTAAAPTENVIAHLTISRPGGITPADLSIDYLATAQEFAACTPATPSGFWCPLTLAQSGSNLASTFGPASGFPLVDDAASTFRTRYHRGGQYTVTTTMDGVTSNQTYASGTGVVAVADLDLSGTPVASNGNTGVALDSAVSLVNSGSAPLGASAPTPNNRDVIGEFTITPASGSVTPAQVVVRYFDGSNYVAIATSQNGNAITGTFGGSGFPVAAGYSATSLFRTTFLVAGNYTVTTRIIGAASASDVFAETVQTAAIGTSSSTIAIDPASLSQTYNTLAHPVIVSTTPAGLAYTLTYTGVMATVYPTSSTPPTDAGSYAVAATITSPGYTGTANGTLVVGKAASTVTIAGPLTQDFGSTTALTATASPISTGSVSITYNGSAATPTAVGSYAVVATLVDPNYTGSATATLVVRDAANVAITFTTPEMSLVTPSTAPFSAQTLASGTLANTGGSTSQKVHYRITAVRIDDGNGTAGLPPAIDADDVEVCLFDPSGWAAQAGNHRNCPQDYQSLFISRSTGSLNGRASVSFRYPNLAANDILLPSTGPTPIMLPPTLFQFKRGEYRVQVDVVGSDNSTLYATASDTTSVPQAAIAYNGATSGPTEQALLSTTNLSNSGGRVVGNVIVRVTLSDAASAPLSTTDADFAYLDGSTFVTLPWTVVGNNLVTEFGPPVTGFELPDGHNQNTAGRGIFHRAGNYGLRYEVVDIATRNVIYATEQEALTIGPNMVNFALSDLDQVYDGTPRDITVSPAGVPHTVVYDASCPAMAPAATPANQVAPTDAGSYCVYVAATGSYVGSASGTLVVAKASAPVSLTGAVAGTVSRTYSGVPQTVLATTTATLAPGGNIAVSYNGSSSPPTAAGSYSLVATIVDNNYEGSTTGTLVISIAGGATITLDGVVGGTISRAYTGAQQAPVTATTTPAIAYTVSYAGSGATVYPLTATPPTAVGSYAVVATTADANYAPVSASGTLVVANASTATLSFSATPSSLAVDATSITSATLANSGGPIGENVLVRYTINRDVAGLVPADIDLRYNAGGLQPLGLSQIGSSLVGYFGPQPGGFPVPAGYSATTAGDAVFHVAGVYSLTLDLVGVTTNTVFATTSSSVTVGQGSGTITIDPSTLSAIYNGSPRPVTVTTSPAGLGYTLSYAGSSTAPTNAGSYVVVATLADPNYTGSDTDTLVIAKAVSPVTFAGPTNVVYTGSAQNPLTATLTLEAGNTAACVVTYAPVAAPTNVGTYTATATCNGTNYTGSASTTLTISASNATVTLSNLAQTYDGTPRPVTVTTNPLGLTTTVTYNGSATVPTNAGTYNVVATITSAGYSGTTSGTLIVDKAIASVTIGNLIHVYNGLVKNATATTTPGGVPVTFTYNGGAALPVNAGSYTVVATASNGNYAGTATATLTIAKAVATVSLSALSQTYDGTPRNATVTTAPAGLAVSVTYNGSPTAPTPVGSYAVVATVVDANYQGSNSGTLMIGKATASVTLTNLAQAYTGSPISAAAITSPAGLGVTLTYDGSTTPPTAVGSYTVQATIVDANYNGGGSATLTITQATATATIGNLSQVYNGAPRAVSVTTNPLGLPRTITYDGSSTPPSAVGSYSVLVTITDPNYTGSATATLTITKATATVTLGGLSQIHDGTPRVVTATTVPGGLTVDITYNGSSTAPSAVGSYAVVATVNDATYQGSATGILVVTNGNATVNVSNLIQVYDGSPKPVTVVTNPVGLTTSVTYNGSATVPTNAGTYTVVATITSPGYSGSGAGTLVIEKAIAAVVVGNLTHVYNGLAKNATATTTPSGVPVTFTYNGSATAPVNAGSYAVVATASNANYSGSATATLTIAKAVATVTLSDLVQVYNGTPRSATVTTAPAGLAVSVSYDGNSVPPLAVGSYAVSASVVDANHQGSANGVLVIGKATATVTLGNLAQTYTGSPISASALTTPAGLAVDLTYNGSPVAPTAVGSYTVAATINDASYSGSGSATLTIGKATATIVIGNLSQAYDGAPKTVSVTTTPAGLPHTVTYNGAAALPTAVGSYAVEVTVNDPSYSGTATATLVITKGSALVTLSNLSQIYDGSPKPVTVTTTPNGLATTVTYDGSATTPTSTGTYAVVATINDATYEGSASGTLVITTGNATVTLSNLAQTYDGTPRPVVVTTNPVGLTTSVTYNGSATVPVNAGSYTVVATVTSAGYSGTGAGTLVVAKAAATVNLGNLAQTYDGSARTVTATTTPAGLVVNLSYAGSPTAPVNAGTYAVTGTISDANYQGSASASLVVSKATAPVVLAGLGQTYTGAPRTVTATTTPAGLAVAITYNGSITAPVDAGSYPIVATINDANYQGSASGTLVVAKAAATVTVSNLSQSFNGTPRPVTVTTTPAGLSTTITYNGGATVPSAVGSYAVLATISSTNHEGFGSGTLVIGDGTATITLTGLSYVYDGSPKSASATTNPTGLSVAFTYDGSATPPTNAGSYGVVATITSSGYTGTANGTLIISKAPATVTVGSLNPTYDGTPKPATATTTPAGLGVTYTYDGSATAPTNAGTYLVVATISDSNYSGTATATLTIAKAAATVTLSGLNQAFNGTPRTVIVTTTPSGLATAVTYDGSATAPTAVGTYAVSATVTNPNYSGSAVGTLQVTAGTAGSIAANGPTAFSGTVSQPIVGTLPSVRVSDSGGNPVAGVVVTFAAGANSGSLSGATQTTGSNGVATLGGWVLGATAPTQTVTATGAGVPGSVIFTASAGGTVNLVVSIDSGRDFVRAGQSISHLVTVGNSGSLLATGVTLATTLPAELDAASLQWICVATSGSSCGSANTGIGNLPTTVTIAAGGNLSFVLTGTVLPGPTDVLTVSVSATRPVGTTGSNGSASDSTQIVIFRDGFEQGGDGAQWPQGSAGNIDTQRMEAGRITLVDIDQAALAVGRITTLARGAGGSFRVEATWIDGHAWLRLVAREGGHETSSAWTAIDASQTRFALSFQGSTSAAATLTLVCGSVTLEQGIAATPALTIYAAGFSADGVGRD